MSDILKPIIVKLCEGNELSFNEMQTAFSILMSGDATVAQITSFMISLKMRGENATDIAAGASQMRANATRINAPENSIDIVGTGSYIPDIWEETYATSDIIRYNGKNLVKKGREFLFKNK